MYERNNQVFQLLSNYSWVIRVYTIYSSASAQLLRKNMLCHTSVVYRSVRLDLLPLSVWYAMQTVSYSSLKRKTKFAADNSQIFVVTALANRAQLFKASLA